MPECVNFGLQRRTTVLQDLDISANLFAACDAELPRDGGIAKIALKPQQRDCQGKWTPEWRTFETSGHGQTNSRYATMPDNALMHG